MCVCVCVCVDQVVGVCRHVFVCGFVDCVGLLHMIFSLSLSLSFTPSLSLSLIKAAFVLPRL